jgi:hypothetical protein
LAKLAVEKGRCLELLEAQLAALDAAIVAASADVDSTDAQEIALNVKYNEGLIVLLEAEKKKRLEIQRQAMRYFGSAAAAAAAEPAATGGADGDAVAGDADGADAETEMIDLLEEDEEEEEEEEEEDGALLIC